MQKRTGEGKYNIERKKMEKTKQNDPAFGQKIAVDIATAIMLLLVFSAFEAPGTTGG